MQKTIIQLPEVKLVGIKERTRNSAEMDPSTAKIAPTVQRYFHQALAEKLIHRKHPGATYCVYTDYESDVTGEYTYFIGEAVSSFDQIPDGFAKLLIPAQTYVKFTNGPGPMPSVCIDVWQKIWQMNAAELGGLSDRRKFLEK